MIKKNIFIQVLLVLCFGALFSYSLVFAGADLKLEFKTSESSFVNNAILGRNKVYISSKENIKDINIFGDCDVTGNFVESSSNIYVFDVYFLNTSCDKSIANVVFTKGDLSLQTNFNIFTDSYLYTQYTDYTSETLTELISSVSNAKKTLSAYEEYNNNLDYLTFLKNNRKLEELKYLGDVFMDIETKRELKYLSPIKGTSVPTKSNRLPNTGRPYRAGYTDGIHGGWDFYADFGETIQALDYGVVVRIVKDFKFSDLAKVKDSGEISETDKLWNLDILRGNQVWIKTMKGDVVFYAHLNEVFDNIKEGEIVFRGQPVGTVGITGVPDQNYTDYHVHVEVHKNPQTSHKKPYNFEDYMAWPWYFKGEKEKYILEHQGEVFETK